MALKTIHYLTLPGIYNSGSAHWQTLWEALHSDMARLPIQNWDKPVLAEWVGTLEQAVAAHSAPLVLVCHSLGCLTAALWAASGSAYLHRVVGAFFVAIPDLATPVLKLEDIQGYDQLPLNELPFPSVTVASTDDPYCSLDYQSRMATAWGSRLHVIGAAGHINGQSGLGNWEEGWALVQQLVNELDAGCA